MMLVVRKDMSFKGTNIPFGMLEVKYPQKELWEIDAFQKLKEVELQNIKTLSGNYDRKEVFGEDQYYRYFKKYKKTYHVMLQLESFLLKGRPFPNVNPINEVAFLAELKSHMLLGTHDVDQINGAIALIRYVEKVPFWGMGDHEVHAYPGDVSGVDNSGIIFSMIAGADNRTCISSQTTHVAYFVFGIDGMHCKQISATLDILEQYTKILSPSATSSRLII